MTGLGLKLLDSIDNTSKFSEVSSMIGKTFNMNFLEYINLDTDNAKLVSIDRKGVSCKVLEVKTGKIKNRPAEIVWNAIFY